MTGLPKRELSVKEWKVIANLLRLAANTFTNNCCNDYDMRKHGFTESELAELGARLQAFNGSVDDEELELFQSPYQQDCFLMEYYADLLDPGGNL